MSGQLDKKPDELPAIGDRAKPLKRVLPVVGSPPELVPARMINEVLYCERLLYLEWAQGEWDDNAFTAEGKAVHARVDVPGKTARKPKGEPVAETGGAAEERLEALNSAIALTSDVGKRTGRILENSVPMDPTVAEWLMGPVPQSESRFAA